MDPLTGLPRFYGSRAPCERPDGVSPDRTCCLTPGPTDRTDPENTLALDSNALDAHFANQTLFAAVCYATAGSGTNTPASCALNRSAKGPSIKVRRSSSGIVTAFHHLWRRDL